MNARNKLNYAHINGSVMFAGLLGLVCQSWTVFLVVMVVLVIGSLATGGIRPPRQPA